jgi:hypothetical protein
MCPRRACPARLAECRREVREMIGFFGLIFSIIIFCVFIGMFIRLGRIVTVLTKMAVHQGAIEKERPESPPYATHFAPSRGKKVAEEDQAM